MSSFLDDSVEAPVLVNGLDAGWRDYLNERGITDESIAEYNIAPYQYNGKWYIGLKMDVGPDEPELWRLYDRFAEGNNKMRWSRSLRKDINPEPTPPFPSWAALREAEVVCEGEWDCIVLRQLGFKAATGTAGANTWTEQWAECLAFRSVTTIYDHDDSGRKGALRLAEVSSLCEVRIALWPDDLPDKYDVTDWFAKDSKPVDAFINILREGMLVGGPLQLALTENLKQETGFTGEIVPVPEDPSAEAALIGSLLLTKNAILEVAPMVVAEDFTRDLHRRIYQSMLTVHGRGEVIDTVSVAGELERVWPRAGQTPWAADLIPFIQQVTGANAVSAAKRVQYVGAQRRLLDIARSVSTLAYSPDEADTADKLMSEAYRRFTTEMSAHNATQALPTLEQAALDYFDEVDKRHRGDADAIGYPTGFYDLDRVVLLRRQELWYVAASPGGGKTAIITGIADFLARKGVPVFFGSFEMSATQLTDRLISMATGVDSFRLIRGNLSMDEMVKVTDELSVRSRLPLHIFDQPGASTAHFEAALHQAKARFDIKVAVVDYVQLLSDSVGRSNDNEQQRISYISERLRTIAKQLDVCIIAASQLNRKYADRTDPMPRLQDLRESGKLEQDASVVLGIHRLSGGTGAQVKVLKNRFGPSDTTIELYFDPTTTRFHNVSRAPGQSPPPALPPRDIAAREVEVAMQQPAVQQAFFDE